MLREMSTTYGRSPGGYLWVILEPVGGIALFSLVLAFGLRVKSPGLGTNFPLFYATGTLCMMMYQRGASSVSRSLAFSSSLLFYPGVSYIDAILARFLVHLLTYLLISYLVFGGVLLLFETRAALDIPSIILSLILAALLGLGIGCLNIYLFSTFPLWESLWGIVTFPLLILSTVFYTFEALPAQVRDVLWYNPLVHVIGIMRRGFYPTYGATWTSSSYVLAFAMVPLVIGLFLLRRYHRDILNR
ncbi:MAG: ABC transporter permease [Tabrizicola sp.]|jgi:capsular polysaccharide transport system permease protein|nr:ABC transporter permease [Tabrizicola sp.]